MPKLTDKKKLCPRCGSPLMDRGDYLSCAMCGYSMADPSAPKTEIKFIDAEVKKKEVKLKIFQVLSSGTTEATELVTGNVYLLLDFPNNIIWIWKGKGAKPNINYNAGTSATKLKSRVGWTDPSFIFLLPCSTCVMTVGITARADCLGPYVLNGRITATGVSNEWLNDMAI